MTSKKLRVFRIDVKENNSDVEIETGVTISHHLTDEPPVYLKSAVRAHAMRRLAVGGPRIPGRTQRRGGARRAHRPAEARGRCHFGPGRRRFWESDSCPKRSAPPDPDAPGP